MRDSWDNWTVVRQLRGSEISMPNGWCLNNLNWRFKADFPQLKEIVQKLNSGQVFLLAFFLFVGAILLMSTLFWGPLPILLYLFVGYIIWAIVMTTAMLLRDISRR